MQQISGDAQPGINLKVQSCSNLNVQNHGSLNVQNQGNSVQNSGVQSCSNWQQFQDKIPVVKPVRKLFLLIINKHKARVNLNKVN